MAIPICVGPWGYRWLVVVAAVVKLAVLKLYEWGAGMARERSLVKITSRKKPAAVTR
jgi:hypothetical protein